jgi:hypothetical protein
VPIPKPSKSLTSVSSYRPISLLSCISKLLGSLSKRLGFFLEQSDSFRPSQGGFRWRLAGVDQIARLETAIRAALTARSAVVAVFCDLSNAFDSLAFWPIIQVEPVWGAWCFVERIPHWPFFSGAVWRTNVVT